jgi:hypothetical protein
MRVGARACLLTKAFVLCVFLSANAMGQVRQCSHSPGLHCHAAGRSGLRNPLVGERFANSTDDYDVEFNNAGFLVRLYGESQLSGLVCALP